jgi:hypothetical protein
MLLAFVLAVLAPLSPQSGALTATAKSAPPPSELAPAVQSLLASDSVSVSAPQPAAALDFWWVKSLPLKGAGGGAPSWQDVEEGTLVGAVRLSADYRDIRGRVIRPGVYTLRYGIQPANGDHLGVSPFRDFLLLSPAAIDKDPAASGHDGTIEMSKQAIGGSHPGVWSIDPPVATEPALQLHKTELGHDAVIMQVPTSRSGAALKFGVVLVGKIEA